MTLAMEMNERFCLGRKSKKACLRNVLPVKSTESKQEKGRSLSLEAGGNLGIRSGMDRQPYRLISLHGIKHGPKW